jgi:hypothetical protein
MKLKKILLLWNYCANLNQTLLKWTLGGPLWKLCPSVPNRNYLAILNIENCLKYNFIKLLCSWHVKSSAIYTPNAYEVICRVARMAK